MNVFVSHVGPFAYRALVFSGGRRVWASTYCYASRAEAERAAAAALEGLR